MWWVFGALVVVAIVAGLALIRAVDRPEAD
jgi:hypothetical protein